MSADDPHDDPADAPARQRVDALLTAVVEKRATDAEREELVLYAEKDPSLRDRIVHSEAAGELGEGWLVRVQADQRLRAKEDSRFVVAERGVGLALGVGGYLLVGAAPIVGALGIVAGGAVLGWSFLRVRLQTLKDDPYRKVER